MQAEILFEQVPFRAIQVAPFDGHPLVRDRQVTVGGVSVLFPEDGLQFQKGFPHGDGQHVVLFFFPADLPQAGDGGQFHVEQVDAVIGQGADPVKTEGFQLVVGDHDFGPVEGGEVLF